MVWSLAAGVARQALESIKVQIHLATSIFLEKKVHQGSLGLLKVPEAHKPDGKPEGKPVGDPEDILRMILRVILSVILVVIPPLSGTMK